MASILLKTCLVLTFFLVSNLCNSLVLGQRNGANNVPGVPSAPQNVEVSSGTSGNLLVTWDPPLAGAASVKGYTVYWTCGDVQGDADVDVNSRTYVITGITPCQGCDVYVTRTSGGGGNAGTGEATRSLTALGITGPTVPQDGVVNVTATTLDCESDDILVTWENVGENGEVGDFIVEWICLNGTTGSRTVSNVLETNYIGLSSRECNISVSRVNCAGIGPSSVPVMIERPARCFECPSSFVAVPFGCFHVPPLRNTFYFGENYCASKNNSALYAAASLEEFEQLKDVFRNVSGFSRLLWVKLTSGKGDNDWYWGNRDLEQPLGSQYWYTSRTVSEPQLQEDCAVIIPWYDFILAGCPCTGRSPSPLCFIRHPY